MASGPPPLPVIPLEYAKPADGEARVRPWRLINYSALIAGAAVTVLGSALIWINVESVLASGPALMLVGFTMLVGGFRRQKPFIWGLGAAHCAVCVLFVALVNLLNWGPRQAEQPFAVMSGAYNLLTLPVAVLAWVRRAG
jgi:hypothetical protein